MIEVRAGLRVRLARQAWALLFRPGLSQPNTLMEAFMRVLVLAKTGNLNPAGEIAAAVPPHRSCVEGGRSVAERCLCARQALGGGGSHGASGRAREAGAAGTR